jgi:MFS family permease
MSNQQISKEEIKQLLGFMNRIKAFEKIYLLQKNSITKLIWGLLLMGAGVLGFIISKIIYSADNPESFEYYTIFPWVIAIFSGLIIQIFSDRHLTNVYSWEKPETKNDRDTLFLMIGLIVIAILISFFNSSDLYFLMFPTIALFSGFLSWIGDRKYYPENHEILDQRLIYFTPIVCIVASILMVLVYLINNSYFEVQNILFGISFGGSFSLTAFWDRSQVEKYLEKIDIDTNS